MWVLWLFGLYQLTCLPSKIIRSKLNQVLYSCININGLGWNWNQIHFKKIYFKKYPGGMPQEEKENASHIVSLLSTN